MKQFKNLYEAFRHQVYCPFCQKQVQIGWTKFITTYERNRNVNVVTLSTGSFLFEIDCDDNRIIEMRCEGVKLSGIFMFSVLAHCNDCSKYGYTIQVHADMANMKVIGIYLNSETFSIEKGDTLYEIRNVYPMKKTEYSIFRKSTDASDNLDKQAELPLIPLDLENPEKTLDRIKGLIVFL